MGCKVQTPSHKSPVTQSFHSSLPAGPPSHSSQGIYFGLLLEKANFRIVLKKWRSSALRGGHLEKLSRCRVFVTCWKLGMAAAGAKLQNLRRLHLTLAVHSCILLLVDPFFGHGLLRSALWMNKKPWLLIRVYFRLLNCNLNLICCFLSC